MGAVCTPRGLMAGSPALSTELHRPGLIDEDRFVVHPKVAGHGPALFVGWRVSQLKLVDAKRFKSGGVALCYRRTDKS